MVMVRSLVLIVIVFVAVGSPNILNSRSVSTSDAVKSTKLGIVNTLLFSLGIISGSLAALYFSVYEFASVSMLR